MPRQISIPKSHFFKHLDRDIVLEKAWIFKIRSKLPHFQRFSENNQTSEVYPGVFFLITFCALSAWLIPVFMEMRKYIRKLLPLYFLWKMYVLVAQLKETTQERRVFYLVTNGR